MDSNKGHGKWWLLGLPALLICLPCLLPFIAGGGKGKEPPSGAAPRICLPCLLPFIAGGVLVGVGAGAVGSFLSDNVFLLATLVAAATLVALVAGLAVSRARGCGDAIPFVSRDE